MTGMWPGVGWCLIAILLAGSGSLTARAQDAVAESGVKLDEEAPRWKFETGQRFRVVLTRSNNVLTEYETRTSELSTETELEVLWEVREVKDGVARIEQRLERLALQLDVPTTDATGKVVWNSADPAGSRNLKPEVQARLAALIGSRFLVRMRDTGEVEGVEPLAETVAAWKAAPLPDALREQLNPDGLTRLFSETALVFPAEQTLVEQGWTVEEQLSGPWGPVRLESRYQSAGKQDYESRPALRVNLTRQLLAAEQTSNQSAEQAEQSRLRSHTGSGEWYFDLAEGYLLGGNLSQRIEAERTYREESLKTVYRSLAKIQMRRLD